MNENLIYIAAAVLLPLLPAYILYRTLPSKTIVKGPFEGFDIQLTGAFGGYFIVVLSVFGFVHTRPPPPNSEHEIWTVFGTIDVDPEDLDGITLAIFPPDHPHPNGNFRLRVPVASSGPDRWPDLVFSHSLGSYISRVVELDPQLRDFRGSDMVVNFDRERRLIHIRDPISLQPKSDQHPEYQIGQQQAEILSTQEPQVMADPREEQ